MLEPGRSEAYQHHISGSALLVKRLTPARFKTDYEKMLFHAHIGPIFTEALMKNERCYLEQPEWMRLYESTIQDDTAPRLTDRSGTELVRHDIVIASGSQSTAMIFGEVYRHRGAWKVRAVGQGYSTGLKGVAADFGVAI